MVYKKYPILLFLIFILTIFLFIYYNFQSNKTQETKLISSNQAAQIALNSINNIPDIQVVSIENTMQVNKDGLGDDWLVHLISQEKNQEIRFRIKQGNVEKIYQADITSDYPNLPSKLIDSSKALQKWSENNLPDSQNFSFYLARFSDLQKYGQTVVNINTVIKQDNNTKIYGLILNPETGEVIRKL